MKRLLALIVMIALWPLSLEAQSKEAGRLHNAGTVMGEILNVPDDIPQQLLDKAECVIVIPSVIKFAFVFGGSYGRGVRQHGDLRSSHQSVCGRQSRR